MLACVVVALFPVLPADVAAAGVAVVGGFGSINVFKVDEQALAFFDSLVGDEWSCPEHVVFFVAGFSVTVGRCHDEIAAAIEGHHFKAGFGFE